MAAIAAVVVVAVGVVLANVLGGSSKHQPTPVASVPNPAAGNSGFPQSQTTPNGGSGLNQAPGTSTTPNTQTTPGTRSTPGSGQGSTGGSQGTPGGSQANPGGSQAGPGGSVKPAPQTPQPTFTNQPTVDWLGMQIITSPTGAVVNSVQIGSEGDIAGFEPGDVITQVAGTQTDSARAIQTAVSQVPLGGRVSVEIVRGSSLITMAVTMQGRPTLQP